MTSDFAPATRRALNAYARGLRRSSRSLDRTAARALAEQHEAERAAAYQQTITGKDAMTTTQDWYCPECCASSSSSGTCAGCDITLVHGNPDGGSR